MASADSIRSCSMATAAGTGSRGLTSSSALADQQAAAAPVIAAFNPAHPANPIAFRPLDPNPFVQGGPKYNAQDQSAARLSLLWKPTRDLTWNVVVREVPRSRHAQHEPDAGPAPGREVLVGADQRRALLDRNVNTVPQPRRLDPSATTWPVATWPAIRDFNGSGDLRPGRRRHGADQLHHRRDGARRTAPTGRTTRTTATSSSCSRPASTTSTGSWARTTRPKTTASASTSRSRTARSRAPIGWQGSFIQPKETVQLRGRVRPGHMEHQRRRCTSPAAPLHLGRPQERRRHQRLGL